jgi:hypothetical protein
MCIYYYSIAIGYLSYICNKNVTYGGGDDKSMTKVLKILSQAVGIFVGFMV